MDDNAYPNFDPEDAENAPLQYIGYRVLSQWLSTDQNFFIVRRFGALGARVALSLQDEVSQLEAQLTRIDRLASRKESKSEDSSSEEGPVFVNNGTFRVDPYEDRWKLIKDDIPNALSKYYAFINQYSQLVAHPQPEQNAVRSVRDWFYNHYIKFTDEEGMGAIDDLEAAYIRNKEYTADLIAVHPKTKSPIRNFLERSLLLNIPGIRKIFEKRPQNWENVDPTDQGSAGNGTTKWENDKTIDRAAGFLTAIFCLGMLVGPLWILDRVGGIDHRLGVITGFVAAFFILVSLATTAKMSDAIAAAAAYAAVLTVFLTLGASSST